uniref:Secreted protein n=1 Tax=Setaria viridis TaxID=4556 RepID=A0A4V6DBE2_SETVI|nr:hypothetical protein SEVIR_2G222850v2 [Setaria viridis]
MFAYRFEIHIVTCILLLILRACLPWVPNYISNSRDECRAKKGISICNPATVQFDRRFYFCQNNTSYRAKS